jgi:ribonuclease Z
MRPLFHPRLINGPFDDPGLLITQLFTRRSVLFDLGDIHCLPPREVLKISQVFISHTHMDHFIGFDLLLRLLLGREKKLDLYGPDRFLLRVFEIRENLFLRKTYACGDGFAPQTEEEALPFSGPLLVEPSLEVSTVILDHGIPCLGFFLLERFHVNIKKAAVLTLGLDIGPWINDFKAALYKQPADDPVFAVNGKGQASSHQKSFRLKELADRIAVITPGQKITYIADVAHHPSNVAKIIDFAYESDHLFIEAAFLDEHRDIAREKRHLTARQAGEIAYKARVKRMTIFHFSPRYAGMEKKLYREADLSFEKA